MRTASILWTLLFATTALAFEPPSPEERLAAIGGVGALDPELWPAFLNMEGFSPIPLPGSGDWLAIYKESGQTFDQFVAEEYPSPHDSESPTYLYLQPIGSTRNAPFNMDLLEAYCTAFFQTEVKIRKRINLKPGTVTTRLNEFTQQDQLKTLDILKILEGDKPTDAFAYIAFTMTDLYPDDSWNFVFGQANLRSGVGVFSFARYGDSKTDKTVFLSRALKIMTHEIGHMYGLKHCTFFHCLMNGSNGLAETDRAPMHLCPVCLRKLHHSTGLDLEKRYAQLAELYRTLGLDAESKFANSRLKKLQEDPFRTAGDSLIPAK